MRSESVFVVATVAVLVVAASSVAVASPDGSASETVHTRADLPALDSFEPPTADGTAVVDGEQFDTVGAAVDAAEPGETVRLTGRFDERVTVGTPNVTITAEGPDAAMIDGGGEGDVLTVDAPGVTVERVWLRNSGPDADTEDAGIWVNGSDATVRSVRLTEITFGVWVNGVDRVTVENTTIVGREGVASHAMRGNGVQLWETKDTVVRNNDVTRVRDGIYFSWAEDVTASDNRLWDLRYGVHYMYSDDNRLENNLAVDNDVGYALMVSQDLQIVNNTAIDNDGQSGHGILLKDIEDTTLRGNVVADNGNGFYVSNAQDNRLEGNLVLDNDVGVHATAGSSGQSVVGNSFVHNEVQAFSTQEEVVVWNGSDGGNYWSDARTVDRSNDGISETRHRPAGTVERLVHEQPRAAAFADSPAFAAVRMAENSFPILRSPGIVDHQPLTESPHDWERYYEHQDNAHRSH